MEINFIVLTGHHLGIDDRIVQEISVHQAHKRDVHEAQSKQEPHDDPVNHQLDGQMYVFSD